MEYWDICGCKLANPPAVSGPRGALSSGDVPTWPLKFGWSTKTVKSLIQRRAAW